ncbi:DUF6378 domain-containing protein [Aromatoleum aromaticum]|uniref:DUF6378 domain-containing protein n=1 Tax=Aromatoleum aromaticum TaxID=551760 RepID=UPI0002EBFA98|nr:DUF6378 domain-containing protein [Aromatoleum aromaticum]
MPPLITLPAFDRWWTAAITHLPIPTTMNSRTPFPPLTTDTVDATEILVAAADCIGDRASQRDQADGERSMSRAVDTFNVLTGHSLSERDGWIFQAVLKLARAQGGRHVLDDYIDGAAYLALAGESLRVRSEAQS